MVTLHAPAEQFGGYFGDVTAIDENSCLLRSNADTLEWLAFRLTMLGCEFEVHEPPELLEYLRAMADRVHRATGA